MEFKYFIDKDFIDKDYILVRPVLIEKTTEANIIEIDGVLGFYEIPVKPHHIAEKGYDLVLVRLYNNDILWKYKITDNGAYPLDDIVVTIENLPIEYVYDYIDQFNLTPHHIEDLYIESIEYFDQNIGDEVEIIRSVDKYDEGDKITITGFNHRGNLKLISFKEDDEYNQGFHISHLAITTSIEAKLDSNNKVIINKEVSDRKYSLSELKEIARRAWKDSSFTPYNNTHFENWFKENIKNI